MYKTELKIDIDEKPKNLKKYGEQLADRLFLITKIYDFKVWLQSIKILETTKGFHLYIGLVSSVDISDMEVLQLQSAMKDDYIRGLFNMVRVKGGEQPRSYWNLLFKSKETLTKKSQEFEASFFMNYYLLANDYEQEYDCFFKTQNRIQQEINSIAYISQ